MTVTTPSAPPVDTGYPAIRTVGVDGFFWSVLPGVWRSARIVQRSPFAACCGARELARC